MKNSFSFQRFYALTKLNFATERRTIIAVGLSLFGFIMLCYIWPLMFRILSGGGELDIASLSGAAIPFISILATIAASLSFRPYFKRSSSCATLMLPATSAEKFISIFVRTYVVNIVAMYALGIIINLIWAAVLGQAFDWSVWTGVDIVEGIASWSIAHAIFLFGATIFRRNALIFTFLCFIAIMFTISLASTPFLLNAHPDTWDFGFLNRLFFGAKLVIAVGLWIWSYIRFTKIQITK